HRLLAPFLPGVHDHFRVRTGPEAVSLRLERGHQRLEVVDLAVERDPDRPVLVRQRLLSRGQVDDREPAMAEPDVPRPAGDVPAQHRRVTGSFAHPPTRRRPVDEEALLVGTAMSQGPGHPDEDIGVELVAVAIEDAGYPTHVFFT